MALRLTLSPRKLVLASAIAIPLIVLPVLAGCEKREIGRAHV